MSDVTPDVVLAEFEKTMDVFDEEMKEELADYYGVAVVRAAAALAHSIKRQCALLEELKAVDGHKWSVGPASALFGDAVLYKDRELEIVQRWGGHVEAERLMARAQRTFKRLVRGFDDPS